MRVTSDRVVSGEYSRHGLGAMPSTRWGYGRRLFPVVTFLAFGLVCCGWAIASKLDASIEATSLAIIGAISLSIIFADPAAALTAASVSPLARRRVVPALFGLGIATANWLVARSLAAVFGPAPWPGRWAWLEWSTIVASQLAVAALTSNRRPDSSSFGPGILVALVWYFVVSAPRTHEMLFGLADHLLVWISLLIAAAAIIGIASLDPTNRLRMGIRP